MASSRKEPTVSELYCSLRFVDVFLLPLPNARRFRVSQQCNSSLPTWVDHSRRESRVYLASVVMSSPPELVLTGGLDIWEMFCFGRPTPTETEAPPKIKRPITNTHTQAYHPSTPMSRLVPILSCQAASNRAQLCTPRNLPHSQPPAATQLKNAAHKRMYKFTKHTSRTSLAICLPLSHPFYWLLHDCICAHRRSPTTRLPTPPCAAQIQNHTLRAKPVSVCCCFSPLHLL